MRKPCSINGCEKPSAGRGWCSTHWLRWRKHGNPNYLAPLPPQCRPQHIGCRADECGRPHHAQGWCSMHAARVKKSGDPNVVGPRHPGRKRLERPSYDGAHKRVSRERGRAYQGNAEGRSGTSAPIADLGPMSGHTTAQVRKSWQRRPGRAKRSRIQPILRTTRPGVAHATADWIGH